MKKYLTNLIIELNFCNFVPMKLRFLSIISALLVCVMAVGMVIKHHHHSADGSVCLCMSIECHSAEDCSDHSGSGCTHDHSGETGDCDCTLHLDEFCYKSVDKVPIFLPQVDFVSLQVLETGIDKLFAESNLRHRSYNEPLRKFLLIKYSGLRAPPVGDNFV